MFPNLCMHKYDIVDAKQEWLLLLSLSSHHSVLIIIFCEELLNL